MAEQPGPGKVWLTVEMDAVDFRVLADVDIWDLDVISSEAGPDPESSAQKKARLLREAAELIRQGTRIDAPIGSEELRTGFLRIAEALEIE